MPCGLARWGRNHGFYYSSLVTCMEGEPLVRRAAQCQGRKHLRQIVVMSQEVAVQSLGLRPRPPPHGGVEVQNKLVCERLGNLPKKHSLNILACLTKTNESTFTEISRNLGFLLKSDFQALQSHFKFETF